MKNRMAFRMGKINLQLALLAISVVAGLLLLPVKISADCVPGCMYQADVGGGSFGGAVAAIGDVNGDGVIDFAIGEHFRDNSQGRVYVFSGNACDDTLFIIHGQSSNDRFGIAISGVGDINDDGLADFMVGGDLYNSGSIYEGPGRVYLFYGRTAAAPITLNAADADWIIDGDPGISGSFGRSMTGGADLNQDGVEDLVIGAVTASGYQGRLYIFLGNSSVTDTALTVSDAFITIIGTAGDDAFGGIIDLGDFNGDGMADIAVTASGSDAGGANSGQGYVFLGPMNSPGIYQAVDADFLLTGGFPNQAFAQSISLMKDINGDGFDDLAVGAPTRHGTDIGHVYIYLGSAATSGMLYPGDADITVTGSDPDGFFGIRLNGDGDIDGDGLGDLVISEPYYDGLMTDVGRAYLIPGSDLISAEHLSWDDAVCIFTGENEYRFLGLSLSCSGDFDNDGLNEIIIGAPARGRVYPGIGRVHFYSYERPPVHVHLDIKPNSCPNPLNVKNRDYDRMGDGNAFDDSRSMGKIQPSPDVRIPALPVAVLGMQNFDVSRIDPSTILLEGVSPIRWNYEDVGTPMPPGALECECNELGSDGFVDRTLKFDKKAIVDAIGPVNDGDLIPLTITGQLLDGTPFVGTDCVLIRGDKRSADGLANLDDDAPIDLNANFPNPFNPTTTISFGLDYASHVRLEIYNIAGQRVITMVDEYLDAGMHSVVWDGQNESGEPVASGIYFYRLEMDEHAITKKMVLLK